MNSLLGRRRLLVTESRPRHFHLMTPLLLLWQCVGYLPPLARILRLPHTPGAPYRLFIPAPSAPPGAWGETGKGEKRGEKRGETLVDSLLPRRMGNIDDGNGGSASRSAARWQGVGGLDPQPGPPLLTAVGGQISRGSFSFSNCCAFFSRGASGFNVATKAVHMHADQLISWPRCANNIRQFRICVLCNTVLLCTIDVGKP